MRIMVLGVGGVGSVSAIKLQQKTIFNEVILADQRLEPVEGLKDRLKDRRISTAKLDATNPTQVKEFLVNRRIGLGD